ncbi:hypothetical protein AC1031_007937 [Aphanomyces cochlioides]|nr:hypothetical protein AC1031_007937 [Aphanomyces cochlioides]
MFKGLLNARCTQFTICQVQMTDNNVPSPRQKPFISYSNVKFESEPHDEFSVQFKYDAQGDSPASLIVESKRSKLWSTRVDSLQNMSGNSIPPMVNCAVVEILQAWLSRSANGHGMVDVKRSSSGMLHLLIAFKDSVTGLENRYWWTLHPITPRREKSDAEMMLRLSKHLELITDNDEPVVLSLTAETFGLGHFVAWKICQSSKHFVLSDGGTTIQVAKPSKYQMTLIAQKVPCTLKYDVYVNSTCSYEIQIATSPYTVEKITTLEIPANSKLRFYTTSLNNPASLILLLKKIASGS